MTTQINEITQNIENISIFLLLITTILLLINIYRYARQKDILLRDIKFEQEHNTYLRSENNQLRVIIADLRYKRDEKMNLQYELEEPCELRECPAGFFLYKENIYFMSEYGDNAGGLQSYCNSGELCHLDKKTIVFPVVFEENNKVWHKTWGDLK